MNGKLAKDTEGGGRQGVGRLVQVVPLTQQL